MGLYQRGVHFVAASLKRGEESSKFPVAIFWGQGGPSQCHQMTNGEGGPKIGQKSVTYYLNGP